jgi:hypothetical protein
MFLDVPKAVWTVSLLNVRRFSPLCAEPVPAPAQPASGRPAGQAGHAYLGAGFPACNDAFEDEIACSIGRHPIR